MRRTRFDDWACPIARVTDLVGDWWTPLVMRQAFYGGLRFDEYVEALGIPSAGAVPSASPASCDEGLLEKRGRYEERPPRYNCSASPTRAERSGTCSPPCGAGGPTGNGRRATDRRVVLKDRETGAVVQPVVIDEHTGERLDVRRLRVGRRAAAKVTRFIGPEPGTCPTPS